MFISKTETRTITHNNDKENNKENKKENNEDNSKEITRAIAKKIARTVTRKIARTMTKNKHRENKTQCQLCERLAGPIIPVSWFHLGCNY